MSAPNSYGTLGKAEACRVYLQAGGESPYSDTASGDVLATFNAAVLGQLVVTDEAFNLKPGLLESFHYDFEKSSYVLKLRKGLMFHNGREATSADLEYSLVRGFFSPGRSFYNIYLNSIAGIDKIKPRAAFHSGVVSGVKIKDSLTIKVRLARPNPSFLHSLSQPYFSLVPREEIGANNLSWKGVPIGAGPYRVAREGFKAGKVALELVDETVSEKAPRHVELYSSAINGRSYDVVVGLLPAEASGYTKWLASMPSSVRLLLFSNQNALGRNQNFRLAMQKLIDRNAIIAGRDDLAPTSEILPKHFWGRNKKKDPLDVEEAKNLLAKVPKELLEKTWKIPFFGKGEMTELQKHYAIKLKEQLSAVGLKIEFYVSPEKFPSQKIAEASPFRLTGRVTDYVDPLIMFGSFESQSPYTYDQPYGENKDTFERLYSEAADAKSLDARYESVRKLSEFIAGSAIAVAIAEERSPYLYNLKTVTDLGIQPSPLILLLQNINMKR